MKNEMALKYLKALSGALAKKNTKSLLKPKVEVMEEEVSGETEISPEDLDMLMAAAEEEKDEKEA